MAPQLQRQAFRQVAGADAHRIEALQHAQDRLDIFDLGAQPGGDLDQIGAQIAGLVDRIDQRQADHAVLGQQRGDGELVFQMVL